VLVDHPVQPWRTIPTHVGRTCQAITPCHHYTDHPHARGENHTRCENWPSKTGPSPRTWGELARKAEHDAAVRTIPTHVGRTPSSRHIGRLYPDHPHARGENGRNEQFAQQMRGPSPRTWGERTLGSGRLQALRTIPTHVGRTWTQCTRLARSTDHPHARGENTSSPVYAGNVDGPSPRTWGEPWISQG